MELFFFYLFGGAAVGTGVAVVTAKNPINSAIFLILTFLSLAGIYVLLNAHFLAVIQVLVYAGAIMVLFLFVIMLLNLNKEDLGESRVNFFKVGGVVLILVVAGKLIQLVLAADRPLGGADRRVITSRIDPEWGGLQHVGRTLFQDYLLPFEVASILLLAAMIGALLIARKRG